MSAATRAGQWGWWGLLRVAEKADLKAGNLAVDSAGMRADEKAASMVGRSAAPWAQLLDWSWAKVWDCRAWVMGPPREWALVW